MIKYLLIFIILILILSTITLLFSLIIVNQPNVAVIELFGSYKYSLSHGVYFINPFSKIKKIVEMKQKTICITHQKIITNDNVNISIDGILIGQCIEPYSFVYKVENPENAIENLVHTKLRSICGQLDLIKILNDREKINDQLLIEVNNVVCHWGYKVTFIQIKDIDAPKDIIDIMSKQLAAEMEKKRILLINDGENISILAKAKAEFEANKLKSQAKLYNSELEAKAIKNIVSSMESCDIEKLNKYLILNYIKSIKKLKKDSNNNFVLSIDNIHNILKVFDLKNVNKS